jgi:hypothetical protein
MKGGDLRNRIEIQVFIILVVGGYFNSEFRINSLKE